MVYVFGYGFPVYHGGPMQYADHLGLETVYLQSGLNGIDTIPLSANSYTLPDVPYSELEKSFFQLVQMPSDNLGTYNNANPELYLFDGDGSWTSYDTFSYYSNPGAMPNHFTLDLGLNTTL